MPPQNVVSSRIDVDGGLQHVRRELLEVHDDGVRRERHAHLLARAAHAVQPEHGILEIVVVQILDALPEPDRLLGGPHAVRIEAEAIAGQRLGERAIALELVLRAEHAALELVRREAVLRLERLAPARPADRTCALRRCRRPRWRSERTDTTRRARDRAAGRRGSRRPARPTSARGCRGTRTPAPRASASGCCRATRSDWRSGTASPRAAPDRGRAGTA